MVSVSTPLTGSQVSEYLRNDPLAASVAYYEKDPKYSNVIWDGRGAEALGLQVVATKENFDAVLKGYDPRTGDVLVAEKYSSKSGEMEHRSGIDITTSVPKSWSIGALALDDKKLIEIAETAAEKLRTHIEQNNLQSRQSIEGEYKAVNTNSAVWAVSTHSISRPTEKDASLQPQLHVHNFLTNMTQRSDGSWGAVHNDLIYKDQKELGRIFRNELMLMARENGYAVEITDRQNTFFELKGIPKELNEEFSGRRQQIVERVQELKEESKYTGISNGRLYEIANQDTKVAKNIENVKIEDLQNSWIETIKGKGYSVGQLRDNLKIINLEKTEGLNEYEAIRLSAGNISKSQSAFLEKNVIDTAIAMNPGEKSVVEYKRAFDDLTADREIIKLGELQKGHIARNVYSTPEMMNVERQNIRIINESKGQAEVVCDKAKVQHFIEEKQKQNGWNYTTGQKHAIETISSSKDSTVIVQGYAGVGKSKSMGAVREFAEANGVKVRGFGFTGKSAKELSKEGIESQTLHSFLHSNAEIQRGKEIWIVDEASMVSSRQGLEILQKAKENGVKVALVGDVSQFQSIEAGRFMKDIQDHTTVDKVEMTEILRQKTEHMQQLVAALQEKNTDKALEILSDRVNEIEDKQERMNVVVERYLQVEAEGKDVILLVNNNSDRIQLNEMIREAKVEAGQLEKGETFNVLEPANINNQFRGFADSYKEGQVIFTSERIQDIEAGQKGHIEAIDKDTNSITVTFKDNEIDININTHHDSFSAFNLKELQFSEGDQIVFLKNDGKLEIQNGTQGVIKDIDERGNAIIKTDEGKDVRLNIEYDHMREKGDHTCNYSHITHAYAVTEMKAQGDTYEHVIWSPDTHNEQSVNYNAFDVSATRATHDFEIYTDNKEALTELVREEQFKSSTLDYESKEITETADIQSEHHQELSL